VEPKVESTDMPVSKSRPTMQDVAFAAGVSLKTVSRVVNNEPRVDKQTKERVNKVIAELGFRRNDIARSLRQGQASSMISLVIEDIANPFYSHIARGVEMVAQQYNYMVTISSSEENPVRERGLVNGILRRRVEGLLIVPAGHDHSYLAAEQRLGTPIIFLDRPPVNLVADTILLDNRGGTYRAITHLIEHGHRRIGMIGGNPFVFTGAERLAGYRAALHDHGLLFDPSLLRFDRDDPKRAQEATHELLTHPDPPTALFATSNRISVAVLQALHHSTQGIAFIGFDDFELAAMLPLPVTVIAHNPLDMGQRAAELLFARLQGEELPTQNLTIPTELIIRGSGELPPCHKE